MAHISKSEIDVNELAQSLDEELEKHIDAVLEKSKDYKYESNLTAENVEEEARLIPAFINETPTQEEIDKSPALQAMQQLKYESENPHEYALAMKDDGNHHFQKKLYKSAILAYTEALKCKHDDSTLKAVLYTNRAAAHFHLGNNRSALADAAWAVKAKPDHMKALVRAALCCFDMEKYEDCIVWCDQGLQIDPKEKKLLELKKKSLYQKKQHQRDERKREMRNLKNLKEREELLNAIKSRNITLAVQDRLEDGTSSSDPLVNLSNRDAKVFLDKDKILHWPVYFLYPEYNQSDFVENFEETARIIDHLAHMFAAENLPDWDSGKSYFLGNLQVLFENRDEGMLVHVPQELTLREVLSDSRYVVRGGCPAFIVVSLVSPFYTEMTTKTPVQPFN